MKKNVAFILIVTLLMSVIPSFTFAVDLQDEVEKVESIFDELTDDEKAELSNAKADMKDLCNAPSDNAWVGVFTYLPVTSSAIITEFGSKEDAKEFVRNFIADFLGICFLSSNDLATEVEAFITKYKSTFINIFGSEGEQLLYDLKSLMLGAMDDCSKYIDEADMVNLSSAGSTAKLIEQVKNILINAVNSEAAVKGDIETQLALLGWEAGNIVEAAYVLLDAVDENYKASLALANAIVRSKAELTSGDKTLYVGKTTSYKVSFFGKETNLVKFALDDSSIGSFSGNTLTASKVGTTTVYVYRTGVVPESEKLNYIFKFDITTKKKTSSSSGGTTEPTEPTEADSTSQDVTKIDSDSVSTEVTQDENNQTVATVTVDEDAINNEVEQNEEGTTIVIEVNQDADVVEAGFNADIVSEMGKKDIILSVDTGKASYSLPAKDLNINELVDQLGKDIDSSNVKLSIVIAEPSAKQIKVVEDQAVKSGVKLVIPPIEFDVVCKYEDKSVTVKKYNRFVERKIKVPEGVDPKSITTAVVQDKKGNLTHVPTEIIELDGRYYVKIKSITNSIYTVIYNNKQFSDVVNHWAKNDVNDMGSRMIINGVSNTTFEPDRDITRAEFMAIVIRALGLMRSGEGQDTFDDVNADDWYYDAISIAKDYSITKGNGDGTFTPNSKITREEAMTMIARAMNIAGINSNVTESEINTVLSAFVDNGNVSEWAKEYAAICVENNIINGYNGKIFAKDNITRAECATIIKRMLVKANLIN